MRLHSLHRPQVWSILLMSCQLKIRAKCCSIMACSVGHSQSTALCEVQQKPSDIHT